MRDFRTLSVWQKAHALTLEIYRCTARFPRSEKFGLASQLRRAAASIPSNIAEGCGRGSDSDFGRFIQNAIGSASEVEYQLLLARDLTYFDGAVHDRHSAAIVEVRRMLIGLRQSLSR